MTTIIKASQTDESKQDLLRRFIKDLVIKSIPAKPFQKTSYQITQKIQLFENDDDEFIIPFHYHQQLFEADTPEEQEFANDDIIHTGNIFEFTGKLLPRQELIIDEIMEIMDRQRCIILSLYCGFGKTILSIFMAQYLCQKMGGGKVGVCCHRLILIEQWIHSIKKTTNAKVQLVTSKNKIDPDADIYIFNLQNIQKRSVEDICSILWSIERKETFLEIYSKLYEMCINNKLNTDEITDQNLFFVAVGLSS
jgi:hypothetical protein